MSHFYSFIKDSLNFVSAVSLDYECDTTDSFNDFCFQKFDSSKINATSFVLLNRIKEDNGMYDVQLNKPVYDHSEEIY